jgi:hypothetical protein
VTVIIRKGRKEYLVLEEKDLGIWALPKREFTEQ